MVAIQALLAWAITICVAPLIQTHSVIASRALRKRTLLTTPSLFHARVVGAHNLHVAKTTRTARLWNTAVGHKHTSKTTTRLYNVILGRARSQNAVMQTPTATRTRAYQAIHKSVARQRLNAQPTPAYPVSVASVSYTHLTLPTILRV